MHKTWLYSMIPSFIACNRDSDNSGQFFHTIKVFSKPATTNMLNLEQLLQYQTNFFYQGLNQHTRQGSIQGSHLLLCKMDLQTMTDNFFKPSVVEVCALSVFGVF